jgi:hypothetical protein
MTLSFTGNSKCNRVQVLACCSILTAAIDHSNTKLYTNTDTYGNVNDYASPTKETHAGGE